MNNKLKLIMACAISSGVLTACSHQQAEPVMTTAVVTPPKVVQVAPAPKPYQDIVVKPAPLKPAPVPKPIVRPAPVVRPIPAPVKVVATPAPVVTVPPVKAKGTYHGAVPIDDSLRQQYQQ